MRHDKVAITNFWCQQKPNQSNGQIHNSSSPHPFDLNDELSKFCENSLMQKWRLTNGEDSLPPVRKVSAAQTTKVLVCFSDDN